MTNQKMIVRGSLKAIGLASLMLYCGSAFAQQQQTGSEKAPKAKFGVKAGMNFSTLFVDEVKDKNTKIGFHGGVFAKLPVTKGFSVQPELLYSGKGVKVGYDNPIFGQGEYRYNFNYIEMPVLAVFNITDNINIHAGPYAAYLAGANISRLDEDDEDISNIADLKADDFERFDYGLAGGVGFDVQNFTFGARYNYGLHDVGKDKENLSITSNALKNSKNSNFQLYIGFGF